MSVQDQLFVFLVCTLTGIAGGLLYDLFYTVRFFLRFRWVHIASDILFCLAFAGLYLLVSLCVELPALRFYSFIGCLLGLFLYLKSFHKIVAFFSERVYNGVKALRKERSECPKTPKKPIRKRK